jgi:hypothetical protein
MSVAEMCEGVGPGLIIFGLCVAFFLPMFAMAAGFGESVPAELVVKRR